MAAAFHDTFFAYILRLAFGSRVFPHPDEKTLPAIWQEKLSQVSPRDSAQSTLNEAPVADATSVLSETTATTRRGDPENGKDTFLVEWDGPTDPDNPQNWSSAKKTWVMFQTCLLTFTIYVGSAIYTAGIPYISSEFHVSTVAATVGLTVFVAGYGLVRWFGPH